ncbi:MAG: cyclic nucleotide-binding domain-containing protein [Myxococcota bacterium]|nr:cyclic nucleotide-binding domain-containing protein [Myxococcota bacterium]
MSPSTDASAHLIANPNYSALTEAEAASFLEGGRARSFDLGEELLREGDRGDSMIVITGGKVEVRRGKTVLAVLQAGETLGEMSLVDPAPRSATVVGLSSGTLIEISRQGFDALLSKGDPAAIKALQAMTSTVFNRLARVNEQVRDEVAVPRGNVFSRLWGALSARGRRN